MNPWDLSCRSKLGEQPGAFGLEQLPTNLLKPTKAAATGGVANSDLRGGRPGINPMVAKRPRLMPMLVDPIFTNSTTTTTTTDHLAAYSTTAAINGGGFSQSSSSSRVYLSSSLSSSVASPSSASSSVPSSLTSSAISSLAPSPASTRSNSIEISEEIQLVQRVAMFNERAAATCNMAAKESLERAIDQLNNIGEVNAIISTNNNTDSSSCSSTSSNGSGSSTGGSGNGTGAPALQDRKARKKDQNRRAAFNYRRKKMEEKNRMREEEMRLVYSRVCLIGYAEKLEGSIMCILQTKTRTILDKDGNSICYLCPICLQSCDNILNLRSHLHVTHNPNSNIDDNKN